MENTSVFDMDADEAECAADGTTTNATEAGNVIVVPVETTDRRLRERTRGAVCRNEQ